MAVNGKKNMGINGFRVGLQFRIFSFHKQMLMNRKLYLSKKLRILTHTHSKKIYSNKNSVFHYVGDCHVLMFRADARRPYVEVMSGVLGP